MWVSVFEHDPILIFGFDCTAEIALWTACPKHPERNNWLCFLPSREQAFVSSTLFIVHIVRERYQEWKRGDTRLL